MASAIHGSATIEQDPYRFRRARFVVPLVLAIVAVWAAGFALLQRVHPSGGAAARASTEAFLADLTAGRIHQAYLRCSPRFRARTPEAYLRNAVAALQQHVGVLHGFEPRGAGIKYTTFGPKPTYYYDLKGSRWEGDARLTLSPGPSGWTIDHVDFHWHPRTD